MIFLRGKPDLNRRKLVLQTIPLDHSGIPSCYGCHYANSHYFVDTRGIEPRSQDFQSCAYTMSAKCPLRKQKDSNLRNHCVARPLSRGLVSTTHPYFLSFDVAKLQPFSATYFRSSHFLAIFYWWSKMADNWTAICHFAPSIKKLQENENYENRLQRGVVTLQHQRKGSMGEWFKPALC